MNKIFKPVDNIASRNEKHSVFLAGSIEMGKAENWQDQLGQFFLDHGFNVFNPRRDDWDSSWVQEFSNPQFFQQVTWEANALEQAEIVIFYFDINTKSPITLLELGEFGPTKTSFVICPKGYWRKGNVDIFCNRHDIPLFESVEEFKENVLVAF